MLPEKMAKTKMNMTTPATTVAGSDLKQTREAVLSFYVVLMSAIAATGVLGNGLVIFVVSRFACMQSVTNIQIVSLASADLLHLLAIPQLLLTITGRQFLSSDLACRAYCFISHVNWFAGTLTLTTMAADRFLAVIYPLQSRNFRNRQNAFIFVLITWLVAVVLMIPTFINAQISVTVSSHNRTRVICIQKWPQASAQYALLPTLSYTFCFGYALPSCFIIVFYSAILWRLRTIRAKVSRQSCSSNSRATTSKSTYLVLIIVVVFMFCNLPYWVNQWHVTMQHHSRLQHLQLARYYIARGLHNHSVVLQYLELYSKSRGSFNEILLTFFSQLLGFLNSALNPLLYSFVSAQFRASFVAVFTGSCIGAAMENFSHNVLNQHSRVQTRNPGPSNREATNNLCGNSSLATKQLPQEFGPECEEAITTDTNKVCRCEETEL